MRYAFQSCLGLFFLSGILTFAVSARADGPPPPTVNSLRSWAVVEGVDEYLAVWTHYAEDGDSDLVGVRFADGKPIDPVPVLLVSGEGNQYNPTLGFAILDDGTKAYRLAWEDDSTGVRRVAHKVVLSPYPGSPMVLWPDELLEIQFPIKDMEEFHPDLDCDKDVPSLCYLVTVVRRLDLDGSDYLVLREAEKDLKGTIPFVATYRDGGERDFRYVGPRVVILENSSALIAYQASWGMQWGIENRAQLVDAHFFSPTVYDLSSSTLNRHSFDAAKRGGKAQIVYETTEKKLWNGWVRGVSPPNFFVALAEFDFSGNLLSKDGLTPGLVSEVELCPSVSKINRLGFESLGAPVYRWTGLQSRTLNFVGQVGIASLGVDDNNHDLYRQAASAGSGEFRIWGAGQHPINMDGIRILVGTNYFEY